MTALIIMAVVLWILWAVFVWMVCSISAIADDAAYRLMIFENGLDDGIDDPR